MEKEQILAQQTSLMILFFKSLFIYFYYFIHLFYLTVKCLDASCSNLDFSCKLWSSEVPGRKMNVSGLLNPSAGFFSEGTVSATKIPRAEKG